MNIFNVVGFAILSLVLVVVFKDVKKEWSVILTILSSVIILTFVITKLDTVISLLNDLVNKSGINKDYLILILKVTGIAYLIELTKNMCVDAGSSSLATKIELAGKVVIVVLTLPLFTTIISEIIKLV